MRYPPRDLIAFCLASIGMVSRSMTASGLHERVRMHVDLCCHKVAHSPLRKAIINASTTLVVLLAA